MTTQGEGGTPRQAVPEEEVLTDAERVLRFAAKRPLPPHFLEEFEGGSAEDTGGDTGDGEGRGEEGTGWVRRKREEDFENWFLAACRAVDVESTGMIS